tara:strand:+ start:2182 stop:3249 length:1068 start_codon:yes stop_codon:yes gene_type:complete
MVVKKEVIFWVLLFLCFFIVGCVEQIVDEEGIEGDVAVENINVVNFSEVGLRDKIAQMIIVEGKLDNLEAVSELNVGGIFFFALESEEDYKEMINRFDEKSKYPLFVSTDLEGCVNMLENVRKFKYFNQVKDENESYELGVEMGNFMKSLGFNLNFAPVLDLEDTIWNCRSFNGGVEEVIKKGNAFIKGINSQGVLSTAKHFPGRTLNVIDTHEVGGGVEVGFEDVVPFKESADAGVSVVMLNHLSVSGDVDSEGLPSSLSENVVGELRVYFSGLIITDDLKMKAISDRYEVADEVYVDAINAGNDILLNVYENDIYVAVDYIENAVFEGRVNEMDIDESFLRIMDVKGVRVIFE